MHGNDATNVQGLYPLMFGTRDKPGLAKDISDIKRGNVVLLWIVTIFGGAILVALANLLVAKIGGQAAPVSVINAAPAANAISATDAPKDAKAN